MGRGVQAIKISMGRASMFAVLIGVSGCGGGGEGSSIPPMVNPPTVGFAYVTAEAAVAGGAGAVYEYTVLADGSVSPLAQASVGAGVDPAAVVARGGHVYVVNVGDGTVSQFNIQSDNSLAPMNPPFVANPGMKTLGVMPSAMVPDPTGSFLYVANSGDDTISQFSIGSGGELTPLTPATVPAGITPVSLAAATASGGTYLYAANSGTGAPAATGSVSQYSIGADGTLTPLSPATVSAGASPAVIAIDPVITSTGGTAFVMSNCNGASCTGSIMPFTVGAGGELTATGAAANLGSHYDAVGLLTDQGGADAYALTNLMGVDTLNGALWQFALGTTADLAAAADQPTLSIGPAALAQALYADTLYVLTLNPGGGGGISSYTLSSTGVPGSAVSTTLAAAYPVSMAMVFLLPP